ncbi:MAG TPA: periplasmic heavy metal sensor, partial [Propylenella sp.]|nr:periplasmic heavy metal sensor [Propylenella sp.]
ENAEALGLSPEQEARTKQLHGQMKQQTIPLGERLIEQEMELDRLFATGEITPERLSALTQEIGLTQAELRNTHLKYHLAMMDVLSAEQVSLYRELRGYAAQHGGGQQHQPHQ